MNANADHSETRALTSRLAVIALVLSLIPLPCTFPIGFVLGIVALVQINRRPEDFKGRGLATAAIALPCVWLVAAVFVPGYISFADKAKQSEAKANLKTMFAASSERPQTDPFTSFEPHRRYAYFASGAVIQPDLPDAGPYQIPLELVPRSLRPDVIGVAVGNDDRDATLDVWLLHTDGGLEHLQDDLKD
jgi:hypothetical protein